MLEHALRINSLKETILVVSKTKEENKLAVINQCNLK